MLQRLKHMLLFVGRDFGPLLAFLVVNRLFGTKAAIIAGLVAAGVEVGVCRFRGRPLTKFFLFSTATTALFGGIDLYQETPFLLRYEAVLTNVVTGLYFFASLAVGKPVIQEFAEKASASEAPLSVNGRFYVRFLTWIWASYFLVKAAFYGWLMTALPFEEALATRALVGKVSLVLLLGGERLCRERVLRGLAWCKLLPEPRP